MGGDRHDITEKDLPPHSHLQASSIGDRNDTILSSGSHCGGFEFPQRLCRRNAKNVVGQKLGKKVIEKYTRESDPEILESTYQYGIDYIAAVPYPAREGIAEILKQSSHPKPGRPIPTSLST